MDNPADLTRISTKALVEELAKREGVTRIDLSSPDSYLEYAYSDTPGNSIIEGESCGPQQLLIVKD